MITTLEAINTMLAAAGIAPVSSANSQHPVAKRAMFVLETATRSVQLAGLWFNKAVVTLKRSADGEIYLPANASSIQPVDENDRHLVPRAGRLYDTEQRTYQIGRDIVATMIEVLPFESLPTSAQDYIKYTATYQFYTQEGGSEPKLSELRRQMQQSAVYFNREDLSSKQLRQVSLYQQRRLNRRWT